jgi:glycosyltransferase involved in cell wall biosynthesis
MRVLASPAFVNRWLNPYNWLLNSHLTALGVDVQGATPWRVLRGQGDVWHVHWPDAVFNQRSAARAALGARAWLHLAREGRQRGLRLLWTVHNLRAHDGQHAALEADFWQEFLPLVDGVVHLSHSGRAAADAHFPTLADRPSWVIPHGDYRHEYVTSFDRDAARVHCEVTGTGPVILSCGRIRPYKNIPALLAAVAEVSDPSLRCVIAGACGDTALKRRIEGAARLDARVRLDLRHQRRRDMAAAHAAADLVVLPYRDILNSGSALLALSLNRPVLVPRRGALAELQQQVGEAWVRCYDGELTADTLVDGIAWARETPRDTEAPLHAFAWPTIARAHELAYRSLRRSHENTPPTSHAEHRYAARLFSGPPRRLAWGTPGLVGA